MHMRYASVENSPHDLRLRILYVPRGRLLRVAPTRAVSFRSPPYRVDPCRSCPKVTFSTMRGESISERSVPSATLSWRPSSSARKRADLHPTSEPRAKSFSLRRGKPTSSVGMGGTGSQSCSLDTDEIGAQECVRRTLETGSRTYRWTASSTAYPSLATNTTVAKPRPHLIYSGTSFTACTACQTGPRYTWGGCGDNLAIPCDASRRARCEIDVAWAHHLQASTAWI